MNIILNINYLIHAPIYFASDLHLGIPTHAASLEREKKFVRWLDMVAADAGTIFLIGDLFDYWFEYKSVVPKGAVRVLGKLAELRDRGIPIYYWVGNHDPWMFGYFEKELGIPVFHDPQIFTINDKKFFIAHGDGLGPGDHGYKFIKKIFRNKICQWAFRQLHPDFASRLANFSSKTSREAQEAPKFLGKDNEWLYIFAKEKLAEAHFDYFVFGHRHLPLNISINEQSKYINTGDWINHFSYAIFDGQNMELRYFTN